MSLSGDFQGPVSDSRVKAGLFRHQIEQSIILLLVPTQLARRRQEPLVLLLLYAPAIGLPL